MTSLLADLETLLDDVYNAGRESAAYDENDSSPYGRVVAALTAAEGWRTDPMPLDGTVIYRRTAQPYRFLPYKPNSQQAKSGTLGRWQMMNEYGGWDSCPVPLGNEWRQAK